MTATEITGRVTIARVMIATATTGLGVQTLPGLPNLPATTAIGIATAAATFGTVPRIRVMTATVTATGIARWPHATTVTGIVTGRRPRVTTGTVTATAPRTCATIGTGTEIGMQGIALGIHETRVT